MQTDLFGSSQDSASVNPQSVGKASFLERTRFNLRLDQVVVGAIGLLVLFVFVFSFGVESGKKYAMAEIRAERAKRERMTEEFRAQIMENGLVGQIKNGTPAVLKSAPVPEEKRKVVTGSVVSGNVKVTVGKLEMQSEVQKALSTPVPAKPDGNFTVQLVSYMYKEDAEEQIKLLAQKGFKGFIIPSGKYLQLCVNAFATKAGATKLLDQLKSEGLAPADAYVRPISR